MSAAVAGNKGGKLPGPDPLESLMDKVRDGDEKAFEDLYSRTVKRLFALALNVVRRRELAEEVVQDVYVQAWSSAGRCDPSRGTTLAWLFTMTHRRAVDVVRREQSCRERDSRHHRELSRLGQEYTDELVLRRLQDEAVLRSLSTISAQQSEAIGLAYFGGHKYADIARILDVSVSAVKSRIRDGLRNLHRSLDPAGGN